jgi:MFS transporter, FSR family, fosmidomycin resistance protein
LIEMSLLQVGICPKIPQNLQEAAILRRLRSPPTSMSLLFDRLFSSVALSHLFVDILNGQRAVLLAYLSGPLGLTNATLGLVSTTYVVSAAFIQPFFGHLADRTGPRWVVAGGVLWMAFFFSLALITPGSLALALLVLASLGSGAFHPAGTMQATLSGRTLYAGKETTATAFFFVFGQMGHFAGPVLAGPLLENFGTWGLLCLVLPAIPVGIHAARSLPATRPALAPATAGPEEGGRRIIRTALLSFILVAALQSWAQQNMVTFVPKHLSDLGQPASVYGLVAALFMGGSAIGNVLGGSLADRFGKRRVAAAALALASGPLYLFPDLGWSAWLYLVVASAGLLTGAVHSILVVLAQRQVPGGMALASGLILGFMFSSGALGTLFSGFLADIWGLTLVFHLNGLIALAAAILALTLEKT